MSGRLTIDGAARRDQIEDAMAALYRINKDIDEIILRTQQANRRSALVHPVLDPAIERLHEIRQRVQVARKLIGDYWASEQNRRWKVE